MMIGEGAASSAAARRVGVGHERHEIGIRLRRRHEVAALVLPAGDVEENFGQELAVRMPAPEIRETRAARPSHRRSRSAIG
jgi:hypothetical protein